MNLINMSWQELLISLFPKGQFFIVCAVEILIFRCFFIYKFSKEIIIQSNQATCDAIAWVIEEEDV